MNKFKTRIDDKLNLSSIIQTVIDVAIPETELILDNYKDYDNYDIFSFFTIADGDLCYNTTRAKIIDGKTTVKTKDLLEAETLSYFIRHKTFPSVNITVSLDLNQHRHHAQVFEKDDTKKFSQILYDICDKLEELDLRLKELEKDKEQELI